ncbi:hypothetical protein, unlikely [Trypanosoma brucei gambiense DAL972]|uniref:Uncharacterized protein n=1 Tax=Trypanosoma brucei gambiense (strain MHOM/CI/86/DAL972) TaxID=679716 RepID=C9ZR79_TRYB9|nr:hypothetical protein, unlikely [Trypanosoma brucei gambiense DAL972]CBH11909.1 hypothetical protein, unlikely [Trypanosoma brucei gambiense DAL972]|eukprot:XP_011774194.1 hypothetical protein, unlikely [Trypanosoma brucei gambiense DAL972]
MNTSSCKNANVKKIVTIFSGTQLVTTSSYKLFEFSSFLKKCITSTSQPKTTLRPHDIRTKNIWDHLQSGRCSTASSHPPTYTTTAALPMISKEVPNKCMQMQTNSCQCLHP